MTERFSSWLAHFNSFVVRSMDAINVVAHSCLNRTLVGSMDGLLDLPMDEVIGEGKVSDLDPEHWQVSKAEKIIEQMRRSPQNVRFDDLATICADHFGEPRQDGTSHKVYKTPRQGDPRVNIQRGKDGKAKAYQVRQVLDAIARLEAEKNEKSDNDA